MELELTKLFEATNIRMVTIFKGATVPEEEIRQAEEKFVESKELAEVAMFNLLSNDVSDL